VAAEDHHVKDEAMMKFEYHEPRSIPEAISLGDDLPGKTRWLAGGTELLPKMKQRAVTADHLVNLKRVPALTGVDQNNSVLRIGALTSLEELANSKPLGELFPALCEGARGVASPNIRRAATIGGNLCQTPNCPYFVHRNLWRLPECHAAQGNTCNAIPGAKKCAAMSPADIAPALIALKAEAKIQGVESREIPLESFFVSPGVTAMRKNEILAAIVLPKPPPLSGSAYLKYSRRKTIDYAVVSVGARLVLESGGGRCLEARVVLGGMAPVPFRARQAEDLLTGERVTEAVISGAAEAASLAGRPWRDIHGSNSFRRRLTSLLTARALGLALIRAGAAR
jgi:xanthine dehydrogenase YagS FAD-binding subunit